MKKRKLRGVKKVLLAGAFLLCVLALSGCGKTVESEPAGTVETAKPLEIGLSFDSFVIERWTRDRDVFVSTAQELGASVNVQNANGDVEEQISQIRYFIKKGVDVIVVIAIDGEALSDVVEEAHQAGIKVVSYDRLIRNCKTDLYVSFDNNMVGRLMGEQLVKSLPDGGKIFAINGSQTDNNVTQVIEGLNAALEGSGIEIVFTSFCDNWLAEMAFDAVNEGLAEGFVPDGLMCGNDDLASQAIKALSENRLAGTIPVVAQDADLSGCQRIVEGTQTMSVYKSVPEEARIAAALSVALAKGEDITADTCPYPVTEVISSGTDEIPCYLIEPVAVNRDNLDAVIIDSGFHRREDVYLNAAAGN